MSAATISVDEFLALEQKVLQAVEIIKSEREARAAAEAERDTALVDLAAEKAVTEVVRAQLAEAQAKLADAESKLATSGDAATELAALQHERESTRKRVEGMLAQLDALL